MTQETIGIKREAQVAHEKTQKSKEKLLRIMYVQSN
jgi:hypothetical protein